MSKKKSSAKTKRQAQLQRKKQQRQRQNMLIFGAIGAVVLLLLGIGVYRQTTSRAVVAEVAEAGANRLGPEDAPVAIVEFGDFGCPACRQVHNSGLRDQLLADYGEQISYTFRHLPVITAQSPGAAEASQCAAEQDAFWPFHDYLYEQTAPNALDRDDLKEYASALGLERDAFDDCLDSGTYRGFVIQEQRAATNMGARGTPTFFVNDRAVPASYTAMRAAIDAELATP